MKNTLEQIRLDKELTYQALGDLAGYPKPTAFRHCHATVIPAEAAIRYHRALGVPVEELRPDLFSEPVTAEGTEQGAA